MAEQPFCFVTRQGTYTTITGSDQAEAEAKGNRNIIIGPVEFCHAGRCRAEGKSVLEAPSECSSTEEVEQVE